MTAEVRAERLSKWYGKVTALQDLSLHVGPGVWGILGPNGSGKTTFMRLVGGQLRPALGTVKVCGMTPFANPEALRHIGACPEADALYDELTGLEFVASMAELSGFSRSEAKERAANALETFVLKDVMERPIGGYSRGMRQRVKLAQAIVHEPDVLLLDEPLTGTDPTLRAKILSEIKRRADEGAVVFFSTHVLPEIEAVTDNVALIARGQLVAHGRVHEIRALLESHPHHIEVVCDKPRMLAAALSHEDSILGIQFGGVHAGSLMVMTQAPDATYPAILGAALGLDIEVASITSPDASLEALFHSLVEHGSRGAGTGSDRAVGAASGGRAGGYQAQLAPGGSS